MRVSYNETILRHVLFGGGPHQKSWRGEASAYSRFGSRCVSEIDAERLKKSFAQDERKKSFPSTSVSVLCLIRYSDYTRTMYWGIFRLETSSTRSVKHMCSESFSGSSVIRQANSEWNSALETTTSGHSGNFPPLGIASRAALTRFFSRLFFVVFCRFSPWCRCASSKVSRRFLIQNHQLLRARGRRKLRTPLRVFCQH